MSGQFEPDRASDHSCRALQRFQSDAVVIRVQHAIELLPARLHLSSEGRLRKILLCHGLLQLPSNDTLDRNIRGVRQDAVLFKQIIKARAKISMIFHSSFHFGFCSYLGGPLEFALSCEGKIDIRLRRLLCLFQNPVHDNDNSIMHKE